MSQEFFALQRESEGEKLFISKNNMSVLTDKPEEALAFFSENHIEVWKKCNPQFQDAIPVKMIKCHDVISIKRE